MVGPGEACAVTDPTWHILTSEYSPDLGGVADFSAVLQGVLPGEVHVWVPGAAGAHSAANVHRIGGVFDRPARARMGRALNRVHGPRILLLQWVPHGFGRRSMNLGFCLWLWRRVRFRGDALEVIVHEPFLSDIRNVRQRLVALAHRIMIAIIFNAARRVHVSIPSWRDSAERFAFGRALGFETVPITPGIAPVNDPSAVEQVHLKLAGPGRLVAHFGACTGAMLPMLERVVPSLLRETPDARFMLIGSESDAARKVLMRLAPDVADRVVATGPLSDGEVSVHIQAADLLIQPYPDGVSSRRTSTTAALRHGACVVTTSGHLTESFWSEDGAVALEPVQDVASLVKRAKALLVDDLQRAEMGMRARELYEQRFSVEQLAAAFRGR